MSIYSPINNDYKNGLVLNRFDGNINTNQIKINNVDLLNIIYPIGSVCVFINDTDPNKIYNNTTWELIKDEVYIGGNDSKANIGDIVGQNYINVIDKTNTGIYRIGYPPEKNKLELTGIGRHIEYSFKDKELKINNELPHIFVKAWKRIN